MLRNLFCILTAGVATTLTFFPSVLSGLFFGSDASIWWAREVWSPMLLAAGGAKLEVSGQENVDASRPTIYLVSHQSTIDIPVTFRALPVPFRFVAKMQLQYVPVIGWYLALMEHVFVDRQNPAAAIASMEKAAQKIQGGISIVVYPEGTRSEDGLLLPFKKGPFALALKARVAVVPVTIEGSGRLMPKNRWTITPGPIRVKIGAPVDANQFDERDRDGLARAVRTVMIRQSLELGGKGGDPNTVFGTRDTQVPPPERAAPA